MSSLMALPDEVLLNILTHVIELPDVVRKSASDTEIFDNLFHSSAIHINRKLRRIALSAIAGSVTWVELKLSPGVMNQYTGGQRWGTAKFPRLPARFATILPQNRPTISISIALKTDTASSKRTYVFPFCLEVLLSFPWLSSPRGKQHFEFIIDCGLLTQLHRPVLSRYIVPLVEALRFDHEVNNQGLMFTGQAIPGLTNRDDESLLVFVHDYARATLQHFLSLSISKSHNLDGAAILIHEQYRMLADWVGVSLSRYMTTSPSVILRRLYTSEWREDLMLEKLLVLNKYYHAIKNLAWWASIHLAHGCTELWAEHNQNIVKHNYWKWQTLPRDHLQMFLGLSDVDLSERYLMLSEESLHDLGVDGTIDPADGMLVAFSLTQRSEYAIAYQHLRATERPRNQRSRGLMVKRKRYVDFDGHNQEFVGCTELWSTFEGFINIVPRARSLVGEIPEIEEARELFYELRKSLPTLIGNLMKPER